jgi:hypothetical protein
LTNPTSLDRTKHLLLFFQFLTEKLQTLFKRLSDLESLSKDDREKFEVQNLENQNLRLELEHVR